MTQNKIDLTKIKGRKQLEKLGVRVFVEMMGGKDAVFMEIKEAQKMGRLTKKQAFDLRDAINKSLCN